ncbi:MAG: hypothetical protein WCH84_06135 [Verrucomicrobiota bacterium]
MPDILFKSRACGNNKRSIIFIFLIVLELTVAGFSTHAQVIAENRTGQTNDSIIGYAWAKIDISIPQNKLTSPFKPLKNGGEYQSLGTTTNGLLIICPLANGQDALAIMPFKDTMGYQVIIRKRQGNKVQLLHRFLDELDAVNLKPAEVLPIEVGHRYDVIGRRDSMTLLVIVACGQPVEINSAYFNFLTLSDYQKKRIAVLDQLRHSADRQIQKITKDSLITDSSSVMELFQNYSGELAKETVAERSQLAKEYAGIYEKVIRKKLLETELKTKQEQEAFEIGQKAKGLVKFRDRWMTPQQALLAKLRDAITRGDYDYARKFDSTQYPLPKIEQFENELKDWIEKAVALTQANSTVERTRQLMIEESTRIEVAQKPKYETYYADENVTSKCPLCKGYGTVYTSTFSSFPGSPRVTNIKRVCNACGGTGQLTRTIRVEHKQSLPQETVSMDHLHALQEDLRKQEAQRDVVAEKEGVSRKNIINLFPATEFP